MSDYRSRKAARTEAYQRLHGVKLIVCCACSGSGRYDDTDSPLCSSCGGTGKERDKLNVLPSDPPVQPYTWRDKLRRREQNKLAKKGRKYGIDAG